jgi:DNA replication ATP-dependent helicase Dna2
MVSCQLLRKHCSQYIDIEVTYGILYYMENSEVSRMVGMRRELLRMIQQRNIIASYVLDRSKLPPMIQDARMCGKCYAKTSCFLHHRLTEDGDSRTSGLKEVFTKVVKHLKPAHQIFFKKWDSLLSKEEKDAFKFRRELWSMSSSERERVGRCFGDLIIDSDSSEELTDAPKINRYRYTFVKQRQIPNFSFTDSQITVGEPIVISDENGHYALANGYVSSVRKDRITVAVDRRLHNARIKSKNFDPNLNQSFAGIMRVDSPSNPAEVSDQEPAEPMVYRLDKDEFSNGMALVRNNLIRIMDSEAFGSETLRSLIVEGKAPTFEKVESKLDNWFSASQSSLNVDQQNAIKKVMSANNYALVLGMPGTGKTTTIAHIIRSLTAQKKSVLLASYTHTAVDNILLKIRSDNISILRLGALPKVHPDVQAFANLASVPKASFEELERSYSAQVVATTCLGISHPIFNTRIFDYCIVDEASQITLPVCLGPIAMARRFVLVGDHNQLPPLVQNKEAAEGGLDVSLFKLLSDMHPESVVNLEHQYRMCEDIMSLSNVLVYSGRLKCGTKSVATRKLHIPKPDALIAHHYSSQTLPPGQKSFCGSASPGSCWLWDAIDSNNRIVFLNTDKLGSTSREIVVGERMTNPFEVAITTQIVEALITVGVSPEDIGVITPYRSQLAALKYSLKNRAYSSYANNAIQSPVEMHTADKFQGRDKEAIVVSLVRSNENNTVGDLLSDWRRINVTLTRARTKLIIVGSFQTISHGTELLSQFCYMCAQRGWVYDLSEGAGQAHCFDEWPTQTQAVRARVAKAESEMPDSDMEVGSNGQSPRKSNQRRKVLEKASSIQKSNTSKVPLKQGKIDPRRLLGKRPILRDIVNEVLGEI